MPCGKKRFNKPIQADSAEHHLGETETRMTKNVVMCRAFTESWIEVHDYGN